MSKPKGAGILKKTEACEVKVGSKDKAAEEKGTNSKSEQGTILAKNPPVETKPVPRMPSEASLLDLAEADMEDLMAAMTTAQDGLISKDQIGDLIRALGYHPTQIQIDKATEGIGKEARVTQEMMQPIIDLIRRESKDVDPKQLTDGLLHLTFANSQSIPECQLTRIMSSMGEKIPEQDFELVLENYRLVYPEDQEVVLANLVKFVTEKATKYYDWR